MCVHIVLKVGYILGYSENGNKPPKKSLGSTLQYKLDSNLGFANIDADTIQKYLSNLPSFSRADAMRFVQEKVLPDVDLKGKKVWKLRDVFKADELYEAYPLIKDVLFFESKLGRSFLLFPVTLGQAGGRFIEVNFLRLIRHSRC